MADGIYTFDQQGAKRIVRAVYHDESISRFSEFAGFGTAANDTLLDRFQAIISGGPSLISGQLARWDYPFAEIDDTLWQPDGSPVLLQDGRTGFMRNDWECGNPASGVGLMGSGDDISEEEFDANMKLQPVRGNGVYEVRTTVDCNGLVACRFKGPQRQAKCPP